jgi:hypothetical protein
LIVLIIAFVPSPYFPAIISNPSSGFWDEPVKILTNPATASKNSKSISNSKSTNSLGSSSALSSSNSKAKKEEIKIKEIFTTSALKETSSSEFYNWCKNSLASMKINELDGKYTNEIVQQGTQKRKSKINIGLK